MAAPHINPATVPAANPHSDGVGPGTTMGIARPTPFLYSTRRGISAASFCLGLWSGITFLLYPFGMFLGVIAVTLGLISIAMGWRSGERGEQLAWLGVLFGATATGAALFIYRFMQLAFEGQLPTAI